MFPAINHLTSLTGKKILFGIMDWGLGHATRSVELIRMLSEKNEVQIASSGAAKKFLESYFPGLTVLEKPGYAIKYSNIWPVAIGILFRSPQIYLTISEEKKWLDNHLKSFSADLIISDNCYGFYNAKASSIIITHQLMLKMPGGFSLAEKLVQRKIGALLENFNEVWVPDYPERERSLSGDLAHKYPLAKNIKFIGPLSRFAGMHVPLTERELDVVYLISGPEPARTDFYEACLKESLGKKYKAVIVSGIPGPIVSEQFGETIVYSHLPDEALVSILMKAEKIVCRSGYSTIMDLHCLGLKAQFIPTPGQTEQEYLAKYLLEKSISAY